MADWKSAEDALRLISDRKALFRHKWMYQWQWFINLNMYAGNQWISWNPAFQRVELMPEDPDKPRVTENKIQPIVRQAVGKVLRQQLKQIAPPDARDEAAVDKAKVRTQLLEHLKRTTNLDGYLKSCAFWGALTGNGFARYQWDENAGPKKKNGTPMGDIRVSVVSPFSLVVPPNCLTLDDMPWIMEVSTQSVAWVKENHGVEVDADASPSAFDQFDARVLDFTSAGTFVNTQQDASTKDEKGRPVDGGTCNYILYWERPTAAHENGRFVIVAGGKVVYPTNDKEAEAGITVHSPSGDLPYNHFRWFDSGFRFWDMGLVEPLVPMQKERNLYASMIADGLRHIVRAGWTAPKGSVKKDEWSADAGGILEYTPVAGQRPEAVAPRAVTPEFFMRIDKIDMDMADIAGMHQKPSPGIRAAAAFALQAEQDNTLSEPVTANVEQFLLRDGKLKLQLARAFYGKGRTIRVTGESMRWEVHQFDRDQIGDSDEVEIQNSGQLAQDKVQRLDQVLKLLGARDVKGEPVIDAYEARRLLDLENSENLDSQVRADINRARYENDMLDKGSTVAINRWDNHDVHLREHYTRMKRLDFDDLTPMVREQYMAHVMAHEQMKAMSQPAAPGAPPGMPPGAPQGLPQGAPQGSNPVEAGLKAGLTAVNNVVAQASQ